MGGIRHTLDVACRIFIRPLDGSKIRGFRGWRWIRRGSLGTAVLNLCIGLWNGRGDVLGLPTTLILLSPLIQFLTSITAGRRANGKPGLKVCLRGTTPCAPSFSPTKDAIKSAPRESLPDARRWRASGTWSNVWGLQGWQRLLAGKRRDGRILKRVFRMRDIQAMQFKRDLPALLSRRLKRSRRGLPGPDVELRLRRFRSVPRETLRGDK